MSFLDTIKIKKEQVMDEPETNLDINILPVFVPFMSSEKFSEATGLDKGVIAGWVARGYITTLKIGKRRVINIASMTKEYSV